MRTTSGDIVGRSLMRSLPAIGAAVLLIAGAVPAVAVPATPPVVVSAVVADSTPKPGDDHDAMPGMDMPADDMPADHESSHGEPAENMPGMDMPAEEMTSDGDQHAGTVSRPRGAVLGTFAGVNAVVLIAAAVLRRKTKNAHPKRSTRVRAPATA